MFLKKQLILFVALFCTYESIAQNGSFQLYQNGYYIKQYSELAGLINNRCKYLFEDSKGFLWISTFQGLSRFDGQHFVNYGLKEGLPSTNITQVAEDTLGFIYVATAKGIVRYTGRQANSDTCFYFYKKTADLGSAVSGMQIIDSSTIVFQRIGGGLYLLKKNKLQTLRDEVMSFEMCILKDRDNNIYAYSKDTFHIYDKNLSPIKKVPFPVSYFMTFYYDNISNIIHTYSDSKCYRLNASGLSYAGPAPDSIIWFWKDNNADKMYYSKQRTDLYVDDDNVKTKIFDLSELSAYSNDLRQTRDRSVWVTTSVSGILRINPLPYYEGKVTSALCLRSSNGRMIIETDNPLVPLLAPKELSNSTVRTIFISSDKNVWYCTNNGLYKLGTDKKITQYSFSGNEGIYGPIAKEIKGMSESTDGTIWFYGFPGLLRYRNGEFKQYTSRNGLDNNTFVRQLATEKDGTVLVSDWYNLFKVQNDTLIKIDRELGLQNFVPNKIVSDNAGFLWIDYNNKIYKLDKTKAGKYFITDSIIPYNAGPAKELTGFSFDRKNSCWIGYNGGTIQVYFTDESGRYSHLNSIAYTAEDGLGPVTGGEYNFVRNVDGNMSVICPRNAGYHLFIFPLERTQERRKMKPPQVCITDMLVNQAVPDWAAMGYRIDPYGLPNSPEFNFKNNDITFNYTATSLRNPDGIVYSVMLKGYNNDWIITAQPVASYTNLPPGDYCFMVKAANASGIWSVPYRFNFTILKPWYKTWWALTLWTVLIISLIVFLFYARLKAVRKEDFLRNLKKSNEFKATLITMLGHDIIVPLQYVGKVANQLKTYQDKLSKETVTESLGEISITASQLQLFGESVVQWIKVQNSEFSPFLSKPFSVDNLLSDLITFHLTLCNQKENAIINASETGLSFSQDPFLVKTILHNLFLNANKFTSQGTITVKASVENERLVLSVTDSGKGMSSEKVDSLNSFKPLDPNFGTHKEKGWGLGYTIIMDLLRFSAGTLHVESKPDQGTTVTVSLPART